MRKGVSPVVAIVLLIAIAVISAVAVWSWVSPLTSKPPTGSTVQYSISVLHCYPSTTNSTLDIKNTGGVTINSQNWDLINATSGATIISNALNVSQTLAPGATSSIVMVNTNLTAGSGYILRAPSFPDFRFTC
jgi:flagellin-like protein